MDPFTPVDFSMVLGAILRSVLDAQAQAAQTTLEFIYDVGLNSSSGVGEEQSAPALRTVRFAYRKLDESGVSDADFELEVPLLGMMQIPMISMKSVTVDFEYDVSHLRDAKRSERVKSTKAVGVLESIAPRSAALHGSVGRRPATHSDLQLKSNAGLKVSIELDRGENPIGVERLLDILELAASDSKSKEPVDNGEPG